MLNEWEVEHLRTIRRIPRRKSAITLERIAGERKLLARANEAQQMRLYGYFKPVRKARIKRENKVATDKRDGDERRETERSRRQMGPTPVCEPGIENRIAERLRDSELEVRQRMGILPANVGTFPGGGIAWDPDRQVWTEVTE